MACNACADAGKPLPLEYAGKGKVIEIDGLEIYQSGNIGDKAIVVFYDIFGFGVPPKNGTVRRVCDSLADAGFLVIMPDFFRASEWDLNEFPPPDADKFNAWWNSTASLEVIENDMKSRIIPFLLSLAVKSFGVLGFCWGGLRAFESTTFSYPSKISLKACASLHGARLSSELISTCPCEYLIVQSGDDPVLPEESMRFDGQVHGFMAARGDWANPDTNKCAQQVLNRLNEFYGANL